MQMDIPERNRTGLPVSRDAPNRGIRTDIVAGAHRIRAQRDDGYQPPARPDRSRTGRSACARLSAPGSAGTSGLTGAC